jgi:error-prone DNA polymerase
MRYAELHAKSNYSFLEGASHPDELVGRAAELGYVALAVTDCGSLAGIVRAHVAAKEAGIKLVVGAEVSPTDALPVVLWATDRAAYGRLSKLLTVGRRRAAKGTCVLTYSDVADHARGLLAGLVLPEACAEAERGVAAYRQLFGDRLYLLAELNWGPDDGRRIDRLVDLSQRSQVPLLAAGDVHYHVTRRKPLRDVLTAIRHGTTVAQAGAHLTPNAQQHLKSLSEIAARYGRLLAAVERTVEVAQRCSFSLDQLRYEYPEECAPPGSTPAAYLAQLTWQGARDRYRKGIPPKVSGLLRHELRLISALHYTAFFLTVWDLVRFARSRGILCQGRGSAANSAVCYCLGITAVDPQRMDVLFERFVSRERDEAPDIDVDFEHERREEVLQYLYEKYGRQRAALTAEVIRYRPRSAVRDIGKALGLSLDRVDALAKNLEGYQQEPDLPQRCRQCGIDPETGLGRWLVTLVDQLLGFPRHLSQHVGGMVITRGPLCELVPIENAAMAGRTVIEWDKNDLDELGILKVDCLALGMLTALRKCFDLVHVQAGRRLTLADIPADDPNVYDMICRADTVGVFQIESRAQMSMLPRLRPRSFYDLVIEVAIVRPGPIQGNMVHPYLRRRRGEEPVTYPNDAIRKVLHKTLGVPLFQEQAMRLAVVAAGFTPGQADQLRRAMGAWRRPGIIDQFRRKLLDGMRDRGLPREFAERVFAQIQGFGEYGFPESHAASFALLVYASAWLKCHYPAALTTALLNSQPMGFYAPAQLIRDARGHEVEVRPVDVNASHWDSTLEQSAVRLGFRMVIGLARAAVERLEASRQAGPFRDLDDFSRRTRLRRAVVQRLAAADAFRSLGLSRRAALWQTLDQEQKPFDQPLLDPLNGPATSPPGLPEMDEQEQVYADYQTTGLSLRRHPLALYRDTLDTLDIVPAQQLSTLPRNRPVRVAGLVLVRQRPSTAKGITFVTLEDETGTANLVIRQQVWQRHRRVAKTASALIAEGILERKDQVIHVVVRKLEDLTEELDRLQTRSRDFR